MREGLESWCVELGQNERLLKEAEVRDVFGLSVEREMAVRSK